MRKNGFRDKKKIRLRKRRNAEVLQKPTSSNVQFVHSLSCIRGMFELTQYNQRCTSLQHVSSRVTNCKHVSIGLIPSSGICTTVPATEYIAELYGTSNTVHCQLYGTSNTVHCQTIRYQQYSTLPNYTVPAIQYIAEL